MNLEKIRNDTPGCKDKIFVNSAGSSLVPKCVTNSIIEYLQKEEEVGGYKLRNIRHDEIDSFYKEAALLLDCSSKNIAFTHDATDAFSKALSSIAFRKGDVILTTDDDYVSNHLNFINLQKRFGVIVIRGNNLENGDLDLDHFEQLIKTERPKLVSATYIPTNSGLIQDVTSLGEICVSNDVLYIVDACQAVGQIPVSVRDIKCDFLSTTGRKFLRGPRGSGMLYVSDRILEENYFPLYIDLHGATWTEDSEFTIQKTASRFEMWEKPYALIIGLKEAIKYANEIGLQNIASYNLKLVNQFRDDLESIDGVRIFDQGSKKCSIVTFQKEHKSLKETSSHLEAHNVFFSVAQKEGALLDFNKKGIDWAIRISPHYFNTKEELEHLVEIIMEI